MRLLSARQVRKAFIKKDLKKKKNGARMTFPAESIASKKSKL